MTAPARITAADVSPEDQQRLVEDALRLHPNFGVVARDVDINALVGRQLTRADLAGMAPDAIEAARVEGRLIGVFAGIEPFAGQTPAPTAPTDKNVTEGPTPGTTGGRDGAPMSYTTEQLTREDVARMFSEGRIEEINQARASGALARIMGVPFVADGTHTANGSQSAG